MSTGYTCDIENGITFEKFALRCAHAIGYLIELRDGGIDAEIPNEFKPSPYYNDRVRAATVGLEKLKKMSFLEKRLKLDKEFTNERKQWEQTRTEQHRRKRKYLEMISKVFKWTPPTSEHDSLKQFMYDQLNDSLRHDCDEAFLKSIKPVRPSVKKWTDEHVSMYTDSIRYHTEQLKKETASAANKTTWVRELKASVLGK